ASVEISQGKARTSALFRRPSKAFADQYAAGNTAFTTFPEKPVASEGGVPIVVNGKIIGAIGASGGTGQQDGMAAAAGTSAAKEASANTGARDCDTGRAKSRKSIETLVFRRSPRRLLTSNKISASRNPAFPIHV